MMLYKLLTHTNRECFEPVVAVLEDKSRLGSEIEALGIRVHALGMKPGRPSVASLWKLGDLVDQIHPDLIQAWMYHSNIVASALGLFTSRIPVLWNIRHTPYELKDYKKLTYLVIRYGAWLSNQPACIIYNSSVSAERHHCLGYANKNEVVIPNGFDAQEFSPSQTFRTTLRKTLGLPENTLLIGMVARYHPIKDHATFLRAAARLINGNSQVHFVLVGAGIDENNQALMGVVRSLKLEGRVHFLGEQFGMAEITAGFDIASLSSLGEAFPNVIGEAMACGVPCVVTDVGDSAYIVGETGLVVPPRDPEALSQAWQKLLEMDPRERIALGCAARQRVIEKFSLGSVVRQYEDLYQDVLNGSH